VKTDFAVSEQTSQTKAISTAMKQYLQKKRSHDEFIAKERSEFELGKKHLANMMGMSSERMTQQDIDKAIDYLFPSGLLHEGARPVMKPPEEIFPKPKDAEFDEDGRPFHTFFYCVTPNYVQTMYEIVDHLESLTFFGDRMSKQNRKPDPDMVLDEGTLASTVWLDKAQVEKMLAEEIRQTQYDNLIRALERLLEHPFSYRLKTYIFKFRSAISSHTIKQVIPQPEIGDDGRAYVEFVGQRKNAMAHVRVTKPGTGNFSISHVDFPSISTDISYFNCINERYQILFPLQFTNLTNSVDIECKVGKGGVSAQAGAIRYSLAMCLRSFVNEQTVEEMHVSGLLTQNIKVRERKKPGLAGARRAYTWLKR